jgi:acetyl esterase/lipase
LKSAILLAVVFALISGCADDQVVAPETLSTSPEEIDLWPSNLEIARPQVTGEEHSYPVEPHEFVAGRSWTVLENVTRPSMTIYRPRAQNSGAAIVVFPGGGYRILAIDLEGTEICEAFVERGITCAVLRYRVPGGGDMWDATCRCRRVPEIPMALQDAQRAIALLRQRASDYGVDPDKVGVVGFSAGGHMVAVVSNTSSRAYDRVDAADDLSVRPNFAMALYPGHLWSEERGNNLTLRTDTGTPLSVSADTPPTFIVQAQDDPVDDIRHSLTYYLALRDAGVDTEMHLYAHGRHGFGVRQTNDPITEWPTLAQRWLHTIGIL